MQGCFEYEETIVLKKASSGTVEISYIVPLKKESNESLLQFLPTSEAEVAKKLKSKSKTLAPPREFAYRELEKSEMVDSLFKRKGKVSYKIDFEDSAELEAILIGNTSVKAKPKFFQIRREFPFLADKPNEKSSSGEKKIYSESLRFLKDAKLNFKIFFPKDSECSTNKGFVGLGSLTYGFLGTETMDPGSSEGKNWEVKIRFF